MNNIWDKLWPLANRLEDLCVKLDVPCPSFQRVSKKWFWDAWYNVDLDALSPSVEEEYLFFMRMKKSEFDQIYDQLINPWRTFYNPDWTIPSRNR